MSAISHLSPRSRALALTIAAFAPVTAFVVAEESIAAIVASDTVRFLIDARSAIEDGRFDPVSRRISVRGGAEPLSWSQGLPAEDLDGDSVYVAVAIFQGKSEDEQPVPYKFKIEDAASSNDGWEEGPNRYFVRVSGGQTVTRAFGAPSPPLPSTFSGDIRAHAGVSSRYVEPRDVFVYLPPGYESESSRTYPVLYLQDGQNVFDVSAVGAEWRVDETAERLIGDGEVEPFIVVAVGNTPARIHEYTPTRASIRDDLPMMGGLGDAYGRFLVEELKPMIDETYRTIPAMRHTALGGSSLGGLISLYLGLRYPDVYGDLLIVSPSIWWDDGLIISRVRDLRGKTPQRIWLDMGTEEGAGFIDRARDLRDALVGRGWTVGQDLVYVEDVGARHAESAWAGRMEGILRFLYGSDNHTD